MHLGLRRGWVGFVARVGLCRATEGTCRGQMGTALAQDSPTSLQAVAKRDAWGHPQSPLLTASMGGRSSLLPVWGHEAFLQKAEDSRGCSELKQKKIGREDANAK